MCPSNDLTKPIPCPPGFKQPAINQATCVACSNGEFSNIAGAIDCYALPAGHYSTLQRTASIPCPIGTYVNSDKTGCDVCTAGSLCGLGEATIAPASAACPIGYY